MRPVLLLLLLTVVANCAPVVEPSDTANIDIDDFRVKRAREVMMFGNQQNESKDKEKRTSPIVDENIDKVGLILAKEAVNLKEEESSYPSDEEKINTDEENNEIEAEAFTKAEEDASIDGSNDEDISVPQSTELAEQQDTDDKLNEDNDYLSYLKDLEDEMYLSQYLDMLQAPYGDQQYRSDNSRYNFPANSYRYRRSKGRTNQKNTANIRILKRARRIKRDLIYPGPPFFPYNDDSYMNVPNNEFPEANDEELSYLLDTIDNARKGEVEDDYDDEYGFAPYEDVADYYDNSQPAYYASKRQAGLTFVPGIKRSRDFYPYFREPEAHFSAFVPQKRTNLDYGDAYQLLMKWAAALRREDALNEEYDVRKR